MTLDDLTFDLEQHIDIKATPEKAFAAVLHRLGKGNTRPDGQSLEMLLEPKPGGRWYRDRGNGIGHLWGFVQVIKAPALLELSGAHVHVVSGHQSRRGQNRTGRGGLQGGAAASRDRHHRSAASQGYGRRLGSRAQPNKKGLRVRE